MADVACPFLIGLIGSEVAPQQVRRDVEGVIAVGRRLEFARSVNDDPVLSRQPPTAAAPGRKRRAVQPADPRRAKRPSVNAPTNDKSRPAQNG
jgi:hypothetical protein